MSNHTHSNPDSSSNLDEQLEKKYSLILYNDNHNEYSFVIDCLIDICKHSKHQAEQCTLIAHHNGKCDVKMGSLSVLEAMRSELAIKGLNTAIVDSF